MIDKMNALVAYLSSQEEWLFRHISLSRWELWGLFAFLVIGAYWWENYRLRRGVLYLLTGIILLQLLFINRRVHILQTGEMLIFHKPGHSIIGIRQAERMHIWSDLDSVTLSGDYALKAYISHYNGLKVEYTGTLPSFIRFADKTLQIIDSAGVYFPVSADYILVRGSPLVHPGIVVDSLGESFYLLDGANYSRHRKIWKDYHPAVYDTYERGAFIVHE
jgi:hypothetical protein